jgi:hypothetical protein
MYIYNILLSLYNLLMIIYLYNVHKCLQVKSFIYFIIYRIYFLRKSFF